MWISPLHSDRLGIIITLQWDDLHSVGAKDLPHTHSSSQEVDYAVLYVWILAMVQHHEHKTGKTKEIIPKINSTEG